MKGEIVSGSSGATAPRSFQFRVSPSLTALACSADVVRLYRIAIEFASCGQSVVEELSRYIPAEGSQNTSLKRAFSVEPLDVQLAARDDWFTADARSLAVFKT